MTNGTRDIQNSTFRLHHKRWVVTAFTLLRTELIREDRDHGTLPDYHSAMRRKNAFTPLADIAVRPRPFRAGI